MNDEQMLMIIGTVLAVIGILLQVLGIMPEKLGQHILIALGTILIVVMISVLRK